MSGMAKALVVVYKDEMLVNQLKKLVETNDDAEGEQIVGTRDDSISAAATMRTSYTCCWSRRADRVISQTPGTPATSMQHGRRLRPDAEGCWSN